MRIRMTKNIKSVQPDVHDDTLSIKLLLLLTCVEMLHTSEKIATLESYWHAEINTGSPT